MPSPQQQNILTEIRVLVTNSVLIQLSQKNKSHFQNICKNRMKVQTLLHL